MAVQSAIKTLLQRWPDSVPKRGLMVTTLNDSSLFKGFMLNDEMVAFERTTPDAQGARYVMVEYSAVAAIKLIDPTSAETFNKLGFEGKLTGG